MLIGNFFFKLKAFQKRNTQIMGIHYPHQAPPSTKIKKFPTSI